MVGFAKKIDITYKNRVAFTILSFMRVKKIDPKEALDCG